MTTPPGGPRPTTVHDDPLAQASAAQLTVLDALTSIGGRSRVAPLAETLGQHPNTVREHLDALVELGLATRSRAPITGRGRPSLCYTAVPIEVALPRVREYAALSTSLADQLARRSADPVADGLAAGQAWSEALVSSGCGLDAEAPADRVGTERRSPATTAGPGDAPTGAPTTPTGAADRVEAVMRHLGYDPQPEKDAPETDAPETDGDAGGADPHGAASEGERRLLLRRCPLLEAARRHPDVVCNVHLGLVRGLYERAGADGSRARLAPFARPDGCLLALPV